MDAYWTPKPDTVCRTKSNNNWIYIGLKRGIIGYILDASACMYEALRRASLHTDIEKSIGIEKSIATLTTAMLFSLNATGPLNTKGL